MWFLISSELVYTKMPICISDWEMTFIANKNKRLLEFMSINRTLFFRGPSTLYDEWVSIADQNKIRSYDRKLFSIVFCRCCSICRSERCDTLVYFCVSFGMLYFCTFDSRSRLRSSKFYICNYWYWWEKFNISISKLTTNCEFFLCIRSSIVARLIISRKFCNFFTHRV